VMLSRLDSGKSKACLRTASQLIVQLLLKALRDGACL